MNKSDIINLVSDKNNLSLADTEYSIKKIIDYMGVNLYQGDRIEIRGFGSFCLHSHKSRIARNPKTGSTVDVDKKTVPFFKCGKGLRQKINEA